MHVDGFFLMNYLVWSHLPTEEILRFGDVGSMDVNGTYKTIPWENRPNWSYEGIDIEEGKNVDVVVDVDYHWDNIDDDRYDVMISGQCFEHVEAPWLIEKVIERVTKDKGWCIIVAPWSFAVHRYPKDCYRFLEDGMNYLMSEWGEYTRVRSGYFNRDVFFVGRKNWEYNEEEVRYGKQLRCYRCLQPMKTDGEIWGCLNCGEIHPVLAGIDIDPDGDYKIQPRDIAIINKRREINGPDAYKYKIENKMLHERSPKFFDDNNNVIEYGK